jgi:hypothetical protein
VSERSVLRVRQRSHIHPDRQEDTIIEVLRGGEVVATIYGSREGVQVISARLAENFNQPFRFNFKGGGVPDSPSCIVPLLAKREECPWCGGSGTFMNAPVCLVCRVEAVH